MPLAHTLDILVTTLQRKGIAMGPHLRAGLSRAKLQAVLAPLGLTPPAEVYELYAWHDGVDGVHAPELLFGENQFLSFRNALQEYQALMKHYGQVASSIQIAQCFPFAGFQGSTWAVYCDPNLVDGLQHPVLEIYHGISIAFENLEHMVQTVDEWFVAGIYDTEPVNEALRSAIRQRLNPRTPCRTSTL